MWTSVELLRLLAASHLLLLTVLLLRDHARDRSALATVGLILTSVCYLVQPVLEAHVGASLLVHAVVLAGVAAPAAFWVLARVHFDDDGRLHPWHWAVLVLFEASGYVAWRLEYEPALAARPPFAGHVLSWVLLPQIFALGIVGHAMLNIYEGSRADLVVSRLRLRYWLLGVTGAYVLIEHLARAVTEGTAGETTVERLYAASVVVFVIGLLVASTLVQPGLLKPGQQPSSSESVAEGDPGLVIADTGLVDELRRLMEVEHVFREPGLTIAALATRLGVHEYKVRQIINSQMGFKNFNAFLHHYRLAEARCLLADPGKRNMTVAQVAFEIGYASLGPFNRAFKEVSGVTPTEFRVARATRDTPAAGVQPSRPSAEGARSPPG